MLYWTYMVYIYLYVLYSYHISIHISIILYIISIYPHIKYIYLHIIVNYHHIHSSVAPSCIVRADIHTQHSAWHSVTGACQLEGRRGMWSPNLFSPPKARDGMCML